MSLSTFRHQTRATQTVSETDPFLTPPELFSSVSMPLHIAPPLRRPPTIQEQLIADLRDLNRPNNPTWASWPTASRGQWARSVLAIADLFQLTIPADLIPSIAFWSRK